MQDLIPFAGIPDMRNGFLEECIEDAFVTVIETARVEVDNPLRQHVRDNGLAILREYQNNVAEHDPKTYYGVYEGLLEPFLANTVGRKHYRTVVTCDTPQNRLGSAPFEVTES